MNISVIVCTGAINRTELFSRCIQSLLTQDAPVFEILVIVPSGYKSDKTCILDAENIRIVEDEERGLSHARNVGVKEARGDVVAFIDDDAEATPGWSSAIANAFKDSSVVCVGGKVIPRWETSEPKWYRKEFGWIVGCDFEERVDNELIRGPIGANMAFRRHILIQMGGFNENLGRKQGLIMLGGEETELAMRLSFEERGISIYSHKAAVFHFVPIYRSNLVYAVKRSFSEGISKKRMQKMKVFTDKEPEKIFLIRLLDFKSITNKEELLASMIIPFFVFVGFSLPARRSNQECA